MQDIVVIDNHITEQECKDLTLIYEEYKSNAREYLNSYNLSVAYRTEIVPDPYVHSVLKDIEASAQTIKQKIKIDWGYLVCRPVGSFHPTHIDDTEQHTLLTSITYLNECGGGETYFENGRIIEPKVGRTIYFDGKLHAHGVSEVLNHSRYTLALWYI
jgi:hypothetical protein